MYIYIYFIIHRFLWYYVYIYMLVTHLVYAFHLLLFV